MALMITIILWLVFNWIIILIKNYVNKPKQLKIIYNILNKIKTK